MRSIRPAMVAVVTLVPVLAAAAAAEGRVVRAAPAPGNVGLPHQIASEGGMTWTIYPGGWFQNQGNMPVYSQGAMLQVNGQAVQGNTTAARVDEETGELVFENMTAGPFALTRRILHDREGGYLRYVDVLKNTQQQELAANAQVQSNMNFGIQAARTLEDGKDGNGGVAWVAQTHANNQGVVEVVAGKGAKVTPRVNHPQGNSYVQSIFPLKVPAGESVAIVHLHATAASVDAGERFVESLKDSEVLAGLPRDVRKLIVNFRSQGAFVGEVEVLRGDAFDVVELRTGDLLRGTLQPESYTLRTFYGDVTLPAEQVVGIVNVGEFRPRQLLVSKDGEIFGGQLASESLPVQLSSGQVTNVPLSQVSRAGYRKRAGEPEEWTFDKPLVLMRTGERVAVERPAGAVTVHTRYGTLEVPPDALDALVLQSEEHGVHDVLLTDGSRMAGLVDAPAFELTLASVPGGAAVRFPANTVSRIQFASPGAEPAADAPTMTLSNGDRLVGTLSGELQLDTTFDTLTLEGAGIRRMAHTGRSASDVQVTLWDEATLSGQLRSPDVPVELASGLMLRVPVSLVAEYANPQPRPSAGVVEQVRRMVAELGADGWDAREQAQASLASMGPAIVPVLKELRGEQSPEAQQRLDAVVKQLEGK